MTEFPRALNWVLRHEGGYVDDPDDPGGATNQGITQRTYDAWRIASNLEPRPVAGISNPEVTELYRDRYWRAGRCADLPTPLNILHFDGCVNVGVEQAAKILQRAVLVRDDGVIGPVTMSAVLAIPPPSLCLRLIAERTWFYRSLVRKNGALGKFLPGGWLGRLESFYREYL